MTNLKTVYTDGGSRGTVGVGSWAYIIFDGEDTTTTPEVSRCGSALDTTNNRMEMTAAIRAIESLPPGTCIVIYSDSGYLVDGINHPSYLQKWMDNGWLTSKGKPVENQDLWYKIIELNLMYDIKWNKIRGHFKNDCPIHNRNNDICDRLCTTAMKRRMENMKEESE